MVSKTRKIGEKAATVGWTLPAAYVAQLLRGEPVPVSAWKALVSVHETVIAPLAPHWESGVEILLPGALTADLRRNLHQTVGNYYVARVAPLTADSERAVAERLSRIEEDAKRLLVSIENDGRVSNLSWQVLENIEPNTFARDEFYPQLTMLINRAHRALSDKSPIEDLPSSPDASEAWLAFVDGLMSVYRGCGGNVTISKLGSEVKAPSKFVQFAWQVMESLPDAYRQYNQDAWTLSQALNKARKLLSRAA